MLWPGVSNTLKGVVFQPMVHTETHGTHVTKLALRVSCAMLDALTLDPVKQNVQKKTLYYSLIY